MAWLASESGTIRRELRDGELVVGSGADADWRVATADLMPRHFVVLTHGLNASVRPFSTENVVAVNGRQTSGAPISLNDGDVVAAGSARFYFTDDAPRARTADSTPPVEACLVDERWKVAHRLSSRSTTIGRDASNAIVIRDPTASRFHAEVRREASGFALHTRGSAGTLLNGRTIGTPCLLEEGDRIEIAYTTLRFTLETPSGDVTWAPVHAPLNDDIARRATIAADRITLVDDPAVGRKRVIIIAVGVLVIAVAGLLLARALS
jgi:predicted component of type VI protein secretion system